MSDIILIIGASSDVGIELVTELNATRENITILAHYNSSFDALSKISARNGNVIIPLQCDLCDFGALQDLIETVKNIGIPQSIVHLPAPKLEYLRFKDLIWEDCVKDIDVQVRSVFVILQALLPTMVKTPEMSKIVFLLSENTINVPAKFATKYTMSKYMLLGLMRSLAVEYSGKKVNINALSPSLIDTKLLSNIDRRMLEANGVTEHILRPDDVVTHIIDLLSSSSDTIYGQNILITKRLTNDVH